MPAKALQVPSAHTITLGVQGIVLDASQNVLLVRHGYRPGWHFPGGGVERGEPVLEALRRELMEETGVEFSHAPALIGLYANFEAFPGDHIALFKVVDWRRDVIPPANAEIAESRFFAYSELPSDIAPGARRRLAQLFDDAPPSDIW